MTHKVRFLAAVRTDSAEDPALSTTCAQLARDLEGQTDELVTDVLESMRASLPQWMCEPPVWDQLLANTRESLLHAVRTLRAGGELPDRCPPPDAWAAEQSAELGTALSILLDGYRIGQQAQLTAWSRLVDQAGLDPELADGARRRGSDFFFAYHRRLSAFVTERYMREHDRRLLSTKERRMSEMRAVLEGAKDEIDPRVIDYPLQGSHLAIIATGPALKEALRAGAAELDCRCLVIDVYPDPWWAWLGRSRPFSDRTASAVHELCGRQGALAGIGTEQAGVEGFRESTREALAAFRAAGEGRPVVAYPEIAVEYLASRDPDAARAFVDAELAPLGEAGRHADRLRETLTAYFESGQNARATATKLGIHHQTVAQRLATVEERTGYPVAKPRAELELALRLDRYLGQ